MMQKQMKLTFQTQQKSNSLKPYNVSADHAMLLQVVLKKAQQAILAWHNSGISANIYNAMLESGANALTSFMSKFESKYG
jgi:phosphoserine aminotransferase